MIASTRGFTLLEVMVALAIMAGVVLTVLASVNYHLSVISAERDDTTMTLLGRSKINELEQGGLQDKQEGTFAPAYPDLTWKAELQTTELPTLRKLVLRVQRSGQTREVALVRFIVP